LDQKYFKYHGKSTTFSFFPPGRFGPNRPEPAPGDSSFINRTLNTPPIRWILSEGGRPEPGRRGYPDDQPEEFIRRE